MEKNAKVNDGDKGAGETAREKQSAMDQALNRAAKDNKEREPDKLTEADIRDLEPKGRDISDKKSGRRNLD